MALQLQQLQKQNQDNPKHIAQKMIKKLAVFDIDGTIAIDHFVDKGALKGILKLQKAGYITTVCTGRGYYPMTGILGEDFDQLLSDDALIMLEHGAKIVNKAGEILYADYFDQAIKTHLVEFVRANIELFSAYWFNTNDHSKKAVYGLLDRSGLDVEWIEKRSKMCDIFDSSVAEMDVLINKHDIVNLELRFKPHVKVANFQLNLTRSPLRMIIQDGNMGFVRANINKSLAVLYLQNHLGVDKPNTLVAGNAMNDLEMLNMDVGHRILVGPANERKLITGYLENASQVVQVDTPSDLGDFLKTLEA
jgi:HAD superfamily hydrolase (TIGR01484 family)